MGGGGGGGMGGGMITNIASSVANVGAGWFASRQLNRGSAAQRDTQGSANALYRDMYGRVEGDYAPYQQAGTTALDALMESYGLGSSKGFRDSDEYKEARALWQAAPTGTGGTAGEGSSPEDALNTRSVVQGLTGLGGGGPGSLIGESQILGGSGNTYGYDASTGGAFESSQQYKDAMSKWQAKNPSGGQYDRFMNSPDYQFNLQQGLKARDMSAASTGRLYSGAYDMALQRYGQGLASNQLNTYRTGLQGIATGGLGATNALANYRMGYGNQLGDGLTNLGDIEMARRLGRANINYRNVAAQDSIWGAGGGAQQGGGNSMNQSGYGGNGFSNAFNSMDTGGYGQSGYGSVANNFDWGGGARG